MVLKLIDIYIGTAGLIGLVLALYVILYTLCKLVIKKDVLFLLIFLGIGSLFYIQTTNRIITIGAIAIMYIQVSFYIYYVIRGYYLRSKRVTQITTVYPHVSIIIPAKNEGKVIVDTITSITKIDYPHSALDIIVIDDGSTDDTYTLVSSLKQIQNLKIIHHAKSCGKANSLNEAIQTIHSEYVLILDADHLIAKNFLKKAIPLFDSPDIVCVQGKNVVRNGNRCLLSRLVEMEYETRYEMVLSGRGLPQFMGSAGIFNSRLLREMGGFNPEMLTEDFEFSHRAYLKNYRIVFDSSLKSFELAPVDFKNFFVQRHRWFRGNWRALTYYLKDFVASKKISPPDKLELFDNYVELAALGCYLFVGILYTLDLFGVYQFADKNLAYGAMLSLFFLHLVTVLHNRKYKLLLFLVFIPFYYVIYAIPALMAMIDNWIIRKEYQWNKMDRSATEDLGHMMAEQEVAAGE